MVQATALKRTPLYDVHVALGAKIVPFAGFELPVQYPDYSLWQRAEPQEAARERQLAYWRARLAGLTPASIKSPSGEM